MATLYIIIYFKQQSRGISKGERNEGYTERKETE